MRTVLITCMSVALSGPGVLFGQNPATPAPDSKDLLDRIKALEEWKANATADLLNLHDEKELLRARVADLSNQVKDIATQDGNRWVLGIRHNMENSSKFRKDLYDATSATLEIQNNTGRSVEMYLNGARWTFPPGASKVNVPYGPVRVRFVYFQRGKAWTYTDKDWIHDGQHARLPLQIVSGMAQESG